MVACGVHLDQRLCVSLFTRKASFLHSTGSSSCGDDVFQPVFPRDLFTVITYSRDQGSLHCCLRHCPPLLPFRPSAQLPRKFSTGFMHSPSLVAPPLPCRILDRFSDNFLYFSSHNCLSPVSIGVTRSQNERETTNGYKYMVYIRQK